VAGHANFAGNKGIELGPERGGDGSRDRHATTRETQHQRRIEANVAKPVR
jgi:hypothetical protein